MQSAAARAWMLGAGILFVFAAVAAILLRVMPGPRPIDYLVIGAIATFTALLLLFVLLTTTGTKAPNVFYKRREKGGATPGVQEDV